VLPQADSWSQPKTLSISPSTRRGAAAFSRAGPDFLLFSGATEQTRNCIPAISRSRSTLSRFLHQPYSVNNAFSGPSNP
jgi:hypothetical protein